MFTKKCKCGSDSFLVLEEITHEASPDEDGVLCTYRFADNEITDIMCKECREQYAVSAFKDVEFCN